MLEGASRQVATQTGIHGKRFSSDDDTPERPVRSSIGASATRPVA